MQADRQTDILITIFCTLRGEVMASVLFSLNFTFLHIGSGAAWIRGYVDTHYTTSGVK